MIDRMPGLKRTRRFAALVAAPVALLLVAGPAGANDAYIAFWNPSHAMVLGSSLTHLYEGYTSLVKLEPATGGLQALKLNGPQTVTLKMDGAATTLMQAAVTGTVFPQVLIDFVSGASLRNPFVSSRIRLANARIARVAYSYAPAGDEQLTLTLVYDGIELTHFEQNPATGAVLPATVATEGTIGPPISSLAPPPAPATPAAAAASPAAAKSVAPSPPPGVAALTAATLHATVASGQVSAYSANVTGGQAYVLSLTGIVGAAQLGVFSDAAMTQPVACRSPNLANSTFSQPADCSFNASGGTVYASVTGKAPGASTYNIRLSPAFGGSPAIQGSQASPVAITPDQPFGGTAGPNWSDYSYYVVNTTGAGNVVVSMTGLTGSEWLDLHVYDNPGYTGALGGANCELGATATFAESCILPAGKTYYLSVFTGKTGGPFTLMVDSPVAPPAAVVGNPAVTAP